MVDITALAPEALVTITHFLFVWGSWFFARLFYVPFSGCKDGIYGCTYAEPLGLFAIFASSVLYFYIARHVLNFLYKGQLPDGENLSKVIEKMTKGNQRKR